MLNVLIGFGGLLAGAFGFLVGQAFSESQKILLEKRRVYEKILSDWPAPNDAYLSLSSGEREAQEIRISRSYPIFLFYGSPPAIIAAQRYLSAFSEAAEALGPGSQPLHPLFTNAALAHNDLIIEMRKDAFAWSTFAHLGRTRLAKRLAEERQFQVATPHNPNDRVT